jgi:hypothetical protein
LNNQKSENLSLSRLLMQRYQLCWHSFGLKGMVKVWVSQNKKLVISLNASLTEPSKPLKTLKWVK